jgi:hypothetical protein
MALAIPAQNLPAGIAGQTDMGLINDLNAVINDFEKELISKYGTQNYALLQELLGKVSVETKTDTQTFEHFEKRGSYSSVQVSANVTGVDAGESATFQVASNGYFDSGTKSPGRVGEIVEILSTGVQAQITAVDKSVANAHTYTIKPLRAADTLATSGTTLQGGAQLLFKGNINAGEGSDAMEGLDPLFDKISNTTTQIRDDYKTTDLAMMEKLQINLGGGSGFYYKLAQTEMNKRFLTSIDYAIMEGCVADQLDNGSTGTTGVIERAESAGGTVTYATSTGIDTDNIHELNRTLDWSGTGSEVHWLQDIYQNQGLTDALFDKYQNGAIVWGSVGGSKEAAVSYGFSSLFIGNRTFHLFKNKCWSPEGQYNISSLMTPNRRNFGLIVPQMVNTDPKTGKKLPSFQIVYQEAVPGVKVNTWEYGGMARQNKTSKAELNIAQTAYVGARVFAANQFAIIKGTAS